MSWTGTQRKAVCQFAWAYERLAHDAPDQVLEVIWTGRHTPWVVVAGSSSFVRTWRLFLHRSLAGHDHAVPVLPRSGARMAAGRRCIAASPRSLPPAQVRDYLLS